MAKEPYINFIQTVLFNFKVLSFSEAIKMPIFIYGKLNVVNLSGTIELRGTGISPGMIKIGCLKSSFWGEKPIFTTTLNLMGHWYIKGVCFISNGSIITIGEHGTLETAHDVSLGPKTQLMCSQYISIGRRVLVSWECQIFDTDFHYLIKDEGVRINKNKIIIADYVWIGSRVSLLKGSQIPSNSVVASNSLVNTNLLCHGSNTLFAGIPVKVMRGNAKRCVFSPLQDKELDDLFYEVKQDCIKIDDSRFSFLFKQTLDLKDRNYQ